MDPSSAEPPLTRGAMSCVLRRLSQRPTAEELKQRNILQGKRAALTGARRLASKANER